MARLGSAEMENSGLKTDNRRELENYDQLESYVLCHQNLFKALSGCLFVSKLLFSFDKLL